MAVFLVNICKFNGCGLTYPSLGDLIQHIEETHIAARQHDRAVPADYDPGLEEQQERQQPSCIPLSSALRFFTQLPQKVATGSGASATKVAHTPQTPASSPGGGALPSLSTNGRASSTGSASPSVASEEPDYDIMTDSEDSNDSWTTQEEFSAEFIMRYGSKKSLDSRVSQNGEEKPYSCPVPGCKKRYKNVNGIKYHAKNGHKKDAKIRKAFKCHCGKSYKTGQGLKNHAVTNHAGTPLTTITTSMGEVLQIPTSQVTTLQPVRVSLSALVGGGLSALPVKTVAARQLLQTSFKDSLRRWGDRDEEPGTHRQAITLTGVSRGNTIQVAVPASGIIPLGGDKELTAVPVSRLLAQGLGGNIRLAVSTASSGTGAQTRPEPVTSMDESDLSRSVSADTTCSDWDPDTILVDSRPSTPPGQVLPAAALPPTPVTPGWQGGPFLDTVDADADALPPTPASLLDCDPLASVPA